MIAVLELGHVPARHLAHNVIERRLKARGRLARDCVLDVRQRHAEREARGHIGERVAGGLGRERRRARQTRVDLDDAVVVRVRVERVLNVALADDAQVAHDADRHVAQQVVLVVVERLRRRHDDRVAGVNAERVKVLHVAHSHAVVGRVAHDLVLELLPAAQRLLDEDLRRHGQRLLGELAHLVLVLGKARAETAERESAARNDRVADLGAGLERVLDIVDGDRVGKLLIDLGQLGVEHFAVLGLNDGLDRGAAHAHAVLGQDARAVQLNAAVERGLAAKLQHDAVGALLLDDGLDKLGRDRQKVDLVGQALGGLHGRNVRVHQHGANALLLERLEALRARIIKFAGCDR